MSLREYLRAIVRRAAAERRADDELDGCELNFRIADFFTPDDRIEKHLVPLDPARHDERGRWRRDAV